METLNFKIEKIKVSPTSYYERKNEPYKHDSKIYIFPTGESILENLYNRHSRPHNFYKKEILPKVLEYIAFNNPEVYENIKNGEWGWRQKCGCTCPCSPGFKAATRSKYDIFVDVTFS
jgi:hypothetical protein